MRTLINDLALNVDNKVIVSGHVYQYRKLAKMAFLVLRDRTGYCNVFIPKELILDLNPESVVSITGSVKLQKQSKYDGLEILAENIEIISMAAVLPFPINKDNVEADEVPFITLYKNRPITLRKEKERNIFKIYSEILYAFRKYLYSKGFVEISSTKLSSAGLEGGSDMFEVNYFEDKMFLTQSPQFYKQMMVGVYERVFEIGKVYRAEGSNSNKHLCEFTGLDFEMGFIDSVEDIMDMEEKVLHSIFTHLCFTCEKELKFFGVNIMYTNISIPRISYYDCVTNILMPKLGEYNKIGLNTEAEKIIGEYAKEKYNSDFVFITKYPLSERPFYAMPTEGEYNISATSETFELLYKGMEVTSGGQRIHNYEQLCASMLNKGLNIDLFESYLMTFKFGMPKHGGMGIGVERIIMNLLNLNSVQEASLIPRTAEKILH